MATEGLTINGGGVVDGFAIPTFSTMPITRGLAGQFLQTAGAGVGSTGALIWAAPIKVTKALNYVAGALPKESADYVTSGGTLRFDVTGSCIPAAAAMASVDFLTSINGAAFASRGLVQMFANTINVHISLVPRVFIVAGLAIGTTVRSKVAVSANCSNDANDYFDVTITEF